MVQVYGMPLITLSTHVRNQDSVKQQALQGSDVLKQILIYDAKYGERTVCGFAVLKSILQ
jgi:hypothetical protein